MPVLLLALLALLAAAPTAAAQELPLPAEDPLIAPPGRCAGDDDPDAHHRVQRLAVQCLLRGMRRRAGLPTLRGSITLRRSATYKARRIAACKVFTHAPCGDALDVPFVHARLTRQGRWSVGENLAWGLGPTATPRDVVRRWLASPSHRAVLLERRFHYVGVRRRRLRMTGAPVGSVIWVAHLGQPAAG